MSPAYPRTLLTAYRPRHASGKRGSALKAAPKEAADPSGRLPEPHRSPPVSGRTVELLIIRSPKSRENSRKVKYGRSGVPVSLAANSAGFGRDDLGCARKPDAQTIRSPLSFRLTKRLDKSEAARPNRNFWESIGAEGAGAGKQFCPLVFRSFPMAARCPRLRTVYSALSVPGSGVIPL
jgi:hypothetical protein